MNKEVKGEAATIRTAFELVYKFWESSGQVPTVGSKLEPWLRQSGTFSEVYVHEANVTFGSQASPGTHLAVPTRTLLMRRFRYQTRWPRLDAQEFVA